MPALPSLAALLQIPLSEQVQETLTTVQEAPIIATVITVCVLLGIVLLFLEVQSKRLSSMLGSWLQIRGQLNELSTDPTATDLETTADRAKLLKAFHQKLEERLRDVLGSDQLIALSYEERLAEVGRYQRPAITPAAQPEPTPNFATRLTSLIPRWRFWQSEESAVELPPSATMMAVFNRTDVAGRLLILGEPGAGKTTTLLKLAQELVTQAQADATAPVPIIFELSNWTQDNQPIDQWLVAQLKEEYTVPPKLGQHWIATHQILPLLDGLDELGLARQTKCVEKLNAWLPKSEPERRAVVCCRTKEFQQGKTKLRGLNGAVELQPLSDGQIQNYLTAMGQPSLWQQRIEPSVALADLARTPLMLTVMAVALANRPAQTQADIFAAYIDERFDRYETEHDRLPYGRRDTTRYLTRLATQLKAQNQTKFLIEMMQPRDWLQTRTQKMMQPSYWSQTHTQERAYKLILGLLIGPTFGTTVGLATGLTFGMTVGLTMGLIFGITVVLLVGRPLGPDMIGLIFGWIWELNTIRPVEILRFSPEHDMHKRNFQEFSQGLLLGLIGGLILWFVFDLLSGLIGGLILWFVFELIKGLIIEMKSDIKIRFKPNQGILASAKNAFLLTISGLILAGLLYASLDARLFMVIDSNHARVFVSTIVVLAIFVPLFYGGGFACMQHFALRLVLWLNGDSPWNYAKFLKYTSELRLTRQTGGEFRFFHDLLREHLAQPTEP